MTFFLLPPDWAEGCGTKRPEASIAPVIVRISRRVTDVIWMPSLGLLRSEEVQTSVKFVKLLSPHPGSFLKAPIPLPMGEGLEIGHLWHRKTRLTLTRRSAPPSPRRRGRTRSGGVAQTDVSCPAVATVSCNVCL